jgi:hypothetical protein
MVASRCQKKRIFKRNTRAIQSVSSLASVLIVFWLGCSRQRPTDMSDRSMTPLGQSERDVQPTPDRFSHTLAITTLNFSIDDCRTNLHAVNRVMTDLDGRTQRDHWASSRQRYEALKATYHQICQQWVDMERERVVGDETRISVKTRLNELGQMFEATDNRMGECEKDYAQARQSYEAKKKQFFEAFEDDLRDRHAAEGRFYTDASMILGLSAIDLLPRHVLVTIEAYAHAAMASPMQSDEKVTPSHQEGLSSIQGLDKQIRLIDHKGAGFGPPVDTEYDRLYTVNGLIVTLAYERHPDSGRIPDKLLIKPSPFNNSMPIALTIPLTAHMDNVANALETAELLLMNPSGDLNQVNKSMKVIRCQRVGMHLKVPVTLDIHGVEIKTDMILDTGASVTVLAKSVYSQGLAKPLDSLPRIRMKTANGFITCPVDTLQISTLAYTNKIAVALTNDSTSLLGANYFAGHRITMDLKNECLYIHP